METDTSTLNAIHDMMRDLVDVLRDIEAGQVLARFELKDLLNEIEKSLNDVSGSIIDFPA